MEHYNYYCKFRSLHLNWSLKRRCIIRWYVQHLPYFEFFSSKKRFLFFFSVVTQWYSNKLLALVFLTRHPHPSPDAHIRLRSSRSLQMPNSTPLRLVVCNWPRSTYVPQLHVYYLIIILFYLMISIQQIHSLRSPYLWIFGPVRQRQFALVLGPGKQIFFWVSMYIDSVVNYLKYSYFV